GLDLIGDFLVVFLIVAVPRLFLRARPFSQSGHVFLDRLRAINVATELTRPVLESLVPRRELDVAGGLPVLDLIRSERIAEIRVVTVPPAGFPRGLGHDEFSRDVAGLRIRTEERHQLEEALELLRAFVLAVIPGVLHRELTEAVGI